MERRKLLKESEIKVLLEVIDCFKEQNNYDYEDMNIVMGSTTIEQMNDLYYKLDKWLEPERYNEK